MSGTDSLYIALVSFSQQLAVQKLDQWASKFVEHCQLQMLKDATIGVDATYYLNLRLNGNGEEPLKHALGGLPFVFKKAVEDDIAFLRQNGITLVFVFSGLDYVNKSLADSQLADSKRVQDEAWHHYLNGDSKRTVDDFGKAKYPVDTMTRSLQKLLADNAVQYMVAPYSATAQVSLRGVSSCWWKLNKRIAVIHSRTGRSIYRCHHGQHRVLSL